MITAETVLGLQERAARALPAEHVKDAQGWSLRHAPGCSWWIGTVLPHGAVEPSELPRRIEEAEEFYAAHGVPAGFQISPGACPDALDPLLAERGYRRHAQISLLAASTANVPRQTGTPQTRLDDHPTREWFAVWHAVNGGDPHAEWNLLARVDRPSAYARVLHGDTVVAVGRAVADTGWAGVFGMVTLPEARGKGAARAILAALADWSAAQRADHMYLQVVRDNAPAVGLYERMGFSGVCDYHYRVLG